MPLRLKLQLVIRLGGFHIVTIDSESARVAGTGISALAQSWAEGTRQILANKARIEHYIANLGGNYLLVVTKQYISGMNWEQIEPCCVRPLTPLSSIVAVNALPGYASL